MALYQKDFVKLRFKNDLLIYSFFICHKELLLYSKILYEDVQDVLFHREH